MRSEAVVQESAVAGAPQRSAGERSEPERSGGAPATAAAPPSPAERVPAPDPEVVPKPRRRTFSAEYKIRILREAATCTQPGQIGALLRREGLYSSHLTEWARRRDTGFLAAAGDRPRGRRAKPADPSAKRVAELERENARLSEELRKAQLIIDIQKKVQALLGSQGQEGKP